MFTLITKKAAEPSATDKDRMQTRKAITLLLVEFGIQCEDDAGLARAVRNCKSLCMNLEQASPRADELMDIIKSVVLEYMFVQTTTVNDQLTLYCSTHSRYAYIIDFSNYNTECPVRNPVNGHLYMSATTWMSEVGCNHRCRMDISLDRKHGRDWINAGIMYFDIFRDLDHLRDDNVFPIKNTRYVPRVLSTEFAMWLHHHCFIWRTFSKSMAVTDSILHWNMPNPTIVDLADRI